MCARLTRAKLTATAEASRRFKGPPRWPLARTAAIGPIPTSRGQPIALTAGLVDCGSLPIWMRAVRLWAVTKFA